MMELPEIPLMPRNILVAPLSWGLGHATRSADLIDRLAVLYPDARILLASDGIALQWLALRYPGYQTVTLPGYPVRYPKGSALIMKMLALAPALLASVFREHSMLRHLIREYAIDLVISDNRFGLWNRRCFSVFLTHQLQLQPSGTWSLGLVWAANLLNRFFINRYNQCWVPDYETSPGLAGKLSHPPRIPSGVRYIGPLSRFRTMRPVEGAEHPPDVLCVVSGPEPQRSIFLEMILHQLKDTPLKAVVVTGAPGETSAEECHGNLRIYSHLPDSQLFSYLRSARFILSRSGYSTLMDLHFTGGKAALVPTPGQTEQEYLAKLYEKQGIAPQMKQADLNIENLMRALSNYKGFVATEKPISPEW